MTRMKYNGKSYELHLYEDPHPGMDRWERVASPCVRCGGSGIYSHYHGVCYRCMGAKLDPDGISVNTLRRRAKEDALWAEYGDELRAEQASAAEVANAAKAAAEFAADWDEAHAEAARRAALVQGFLGKVGEKVTNIPVSIRYAKYNEGAWNRSPSMFIIAESDAGQVIKISGSSQSLFGLERGDRAVILSAKVKDHGEYQGQQQTILWHVKVDDFEARAAQAMAYGVTDVEEAVERAHVKGNERERFERFVEAQRAQYEKELLGA